MEDQMAAALGANKLLFEAMTAHMTKQINKFKDEMFEAFEQKMHQTSSSDSSKSPRQSRKGKSDKGPLQVSSGHERTDKELKKLSRDRERIGRDRVGSDQVKESSVQNRKVGDQRSKHQTKQLPKQARKQKDDDDIKKSLQEVFKAMEAVQKEKRHQSAGSGVNKERLKGLENQKPKQNQPLPIHKEPMVYTEHMKSSTTRDEEASIAVHNPEKELVTRTDLQQHGICLNQEYEVDPYKSLFYTKCSVQEKICSLIVDPSISTNVASSIMVEKLSLKTKKHPEPYKLQSLANNGEIEVTRQVVVSFSIGKYVDKVLCDVLPIEASHIVLGQPWNSDRQAIHQSLTNRYSFQLGKMKISLIPLSPLEAYPNQQAKNKAMDQLASLKTSLEAKCFLSSIQSDFDLEKLIPLEPEQPSSIDFFSGKIQRSLPLVCELEQSSKLEPEQVLLPFPCDYPRKHCKELDLVQTGPNLFVIVSAQDEKRFGLENVKEFRVSSSVFDKMIPSFETFTPERISKQMGFQIDEFREFSSSLNVSLCGNVFDMFRSETNCALIGTWPELICLFKNMLIEPCKLNVDDYVLELNHSNMILNSLNNKSRFDHLERLFFCSYHTFDVFSLVFVKEQERQVENSKAKTIQVLGNQVDYGPSQHMSFPFAFWSWKYLRKTSSHTQGCSILKLYLDTISITICETFPLVSKLFPFDVGDLELSKTESTNHEHRRIVSFYSIFKDEPPDVLLVLRSYFRFQQAKPYKAPRTVFKRTKRVQVWEEDHRFKPPDLNQNKHQNFTLFILIKEEPPDATTQPKTRLHTFGGNFLSIVHFLITNLLYFHADNLDLRSNPFQEGEDDVIMTRPSVDLELNDARLDLLDSTQSAYASEGSLSEAEELAEEEIMRVPAGAMTRARTRLYNKAIGGLIDRIQMQVDGDSSLATSVMTCI